MKMSVDPGVTGTGIAIWEANDWKFKLTNPIWVGNLYPNKDSGFNDKVSDILTKIYDLTQKYGVTEIWCEMPEFFDDAGGHMAAKKGDLTKLTFFVGAIHGFCIFNGIKFHPVTPSTWKGQTSKEQVIRKIEYILPSIVNLNPKSHSYDAIGIGLWAQEFYKRDLKK